MSESFDRLEGLFHAAMERPTAERSDFIEAVEDADLRAELRELVVARSMADTFLVQPPELSAADEARVGHVALGEVVGDFRIEHALAAGGMGAVYVAQQLRPPRAVALKVIRPEIAGTIALARFELEAEILGSMRHPGIAQVYGAGVHENASGSIPWLAMELIDGERLDRWVKDSRPDRQEVCRLFIELCRAAEHAHRRGIIHRDLKPANVLVTADGQPKILDFGVARVTDVNALATVETDLQRVVGTLAYMSPEQTVGNPYGIDTRTDVYALGVILYELLSGRRPHDLKSVSALEAMRVIRDDEAPRLAGLNPELRGDLDLIVARAMSKERTERYGSAAALAADVENHLAHRPITARPTTAAYRLRKFVRRNPTLTIGAVSTVLALVVGLVGTLAGLSKAQEESRLKNVALTDFERLADVRRVADALAEAETLWPPRPHTLQPMEEWLLHAKELVARRPRHEAKLAALREHALPYGEPERLREHADTIALIAQLEARQTELDRLAEEVDDDQRLDRIEAELDDLEERMEEERARTRVRSWWSFGEDRLLQWQADVLGGLIADLDELESTTIPDVERRLARTHAVVAATVEAHAESWKTVVAEAREDGIELSPRIGLIPLGRDPSSGRHEFLHFESHAGPIPQRDGDGKLDVGLDTGIILVLVPGGGFPLGASSDPEAEGYVAGARFDEGPRHEVDLDPYFLSKYELTRGQWERITGGPDPSHWVPANTGGLVSSETYRLFPVEQVSYEQCLEALHRVGLLLPTEAQWERACRAGSTSLYSFGNDPALLDQHANAADVSYGRVSDGARHAADLDDGHAITAPVGRYRANPLGFHDMHGNVSEWCLDTYTTLSRTPRAGDGLRSDLTSDTFVIRGGSFNFVPALLRTTLRHFERRDFRINLTGCRAAMHVHSTETDGMDDRRR